MTDYPGKKTSEAAARGAIDGQTFWGGDGSSKVQKMGSIGKGGGVRSFRNTANGARYSQEVDVPKKRNKDVGSGLRCLLSLVTYSSQDACVMQM